MNELVFVLQQMLFYAIPLLIVALGGMFSERSGIVNIALEGIMLIGAFFGILAVKIFQLSIPQSLVYNTSFEQIVLITGLLIAGLFGLLFSLFHAYASINMRADQVISGTALNMFAAAAVIFIARALDVTGHSQQVTFIGTPFIINEIPILSQIPIIGRVLFKQFYITTYIGILILLITQLVVYKTRFGLRLRACGENPQAAQAAGVNVYKVRYRGVALSGLLAGVGGYIYILTTDIQFNATVSGYGFLALAVLIFGQWKPYRILYAALAFGLMSAIAYSDLSLLRGLRISKYFYNMVPYVTTIIILAFTSHKTQGPRAAGEIYDAGKR